MSALRSTAPQPKLFQDGAWVADEYTDAVRFKTASGLRERDRLVKQYGWKPLALFDSHAEAWAFVVKRAEGKVAAAESALIRARKQIAKVRKKAEAAK